MAMTADDMLKLRDKFITLDTYKVDQAKINEKIDCIEKSQAKNDLVVVRIDTQLKLILWVLATVGAAVIALVIRTFAG